MPCIVNLSLREGDTGEGPRFLWEGESEVDGDDVHQPVEWFC